jgi:hypothetical protein
LRIYFHLHWQASRPHSVDYTLITRDGYTPCEIRPNSRAGAPLRRYLLALVAIGKMKYKAAPFNQPVFQGEYPGWAFKPGRFQAFPRLQGGKGAGSNQEDG